MRWYKNFRNTNSQLCFLLIKMNDYGTKALKKK
jgi:hypothetical protein